MELEWIATDPESGRLPPLEARTPAEAYVTHMQALRTLGAGYTEVSWADRPYPRLALSFRNPYGIVHQLNEDTIFLLLGDGVLGDDETAEVPVMDEPYSDFTGHFVLSADHAWDVIKAFIRSGSVDNLGEWWQL